MKFNFNGIFLILLMVIYSFAISVPLKASLSNNETTFLKNHGEQSYAQSPIQLNLYTNHSIGLIQPVVNVLDSNQEDLTKSLYGLHSSISLSLSAEVKRQYNTLKNTHIAFQRHDIIFPFHYFW